MSKAIRIREHLYEEIERRAEKGHRSIINQLELLIEQALKIDEDSGAAEGRSSSAVAERVTIPDPARASAPENSFRPDPKPAPKPKKGRR